MPWLEDLKFPRGYQMGTHINLFRRDQIYFVEKNNKTGVSDLYSLDEFSPRKSENIQKGYLQGRYGAMPFVNLEDIEW